MRLLPALCVVTTTACGRIAFDPLDTDAGTTADVPTGPAQPLVWLTMDDAGTTILTDSSGNAHHAITAGTSMPTSVPGIHGTAAHFDGVDDFAAITDAPDLDVTTITIAAWVRADAQANDYVQIVSRQFSTGNQDDWIFGYRDPGLAPGAPYQIAFRTTTDPIGLALGISSTGDLNTWVHIAATYDGVAERLYRNGVEIASVPNSGPIVPDTTRIVIGAADNGRATVEELFTGSMDDLLIYPTALSSSDIAALATP